MKYASVPSTAPGGLVGSVSSGLCVHHATVVNAVEAGLACAAWACAALKVAFELSAALCGLWDKIGY